MTLATDFGGIAAAWRSDEDLAELSALVNGAEPLVMPVGWLGAGRYGGAVEGVWLAAVRAVVSLAIRGEVATEEEALGRAAGRTYDVTLGAGGRNPGPTREDFQAIVRVQVSRAYNQAVLERVLARGEDEIAVPDAAGEGEGAACVARGVTGVQSAAQVHDALIRLLGRGEDVPGPVVPGYAGCRHVVRPQTRPERTAARGAAGAFAGGSSGAAVRDREEPGATRGRARPRDPRRLVDALGGAR